MPLLISQSDLQPLFTSADFYLHLFDVIRDSLLQQNDDGPGDVSWLAFSTSHEQTHINVHLLSTPVEGTSIRIFPHRVGAQAKDSMFTLLFDEQDGHLLALISLDDIGPLRTSAPVALAARYLCPAQARILGLIGSGLQARYHLQGLRHAVPALERVRVFSPTAENRTHFAASMSAETGLSVEAVESARQAVEGADIVAVTAASNEPVLETAWIRPGTLLTNIAGRALPRDIYAHTRLVVPDLVGPIHRPSGWDPFPMTLNGGLDPSIIAVTLVDLLRDPYLHARQQEDEIVLYEQRGTFAWDGAMNRWLYMWAVENRAGTLFHISSQG